MTYDLAKLELGRRPVTVVEIDGDFCKLRFANDPCTAGARNTTHPNLLQRSEDFSHADWDGTSGMVTANSTAAPNGTTTADTLTDDDAGVSEVREQDYTVANDSASYTASVHLQVTSGHSHKKALRLQLTGGTPVDALVVIDTNTGELAASAGVSQTHLERIDENGVDYWRVGVTATNNASGNTTATVGIYPAANTTVTASLAAATTGACVAWGAQLQSGSSMGRYRQRNTDTLTAAVGAECYNTYGTCSARGVFSKGTRTYRFTTANTPLPPTIDAQPSIVSVSYAPQQILPGSLGMRASITITLLDHVDDDSLTDPYKATRGYDPATRGTFWGKWLARNPHHFGRPLRIRTGFISAPFSWDDFEDRTYVIEKVDPPNSRGEVRITAKDTLKLADDARAQCPAISTEALAASINTTDTTLTFDSNAIALAYKAASDYVAIGDEVIQLGTVSAATITGCTRARAGTTAEAHDTDDAVQTVIYYNDNAVDIIYDLLTTHAGIDAGLITLADWEDERDTYLADYTLERWICKPTGVKKLVEEIQRDCLIDIWWDEQAQKIQLKSNSPWAVEQPASISDAEIVRGSLEQIAEAAMRVTQVWMFYGVRNHMEDADEQNCARYYAEVDAGAESTNEFGQQSIRKIYSPWIPASGGTQAQVTVGRIAGRFADTPKRIRWQSDAAHAVAETGDVITLETRRVQNADGSAATTLLQVTKVTPKTEGHLYEYEGLVYQGRPALELTISTNQSTTYNIDTALSQPDAPVDVLVTVDPGVDMYGSPALTDFGLPEGSTVRLVNSGNIKGRGGVGGAGGTAEVEYDGEPPGGWNTITEDDGSDGADGGDAIQAYTSWEIDNSAGYIFGGGGGGGGGKGYTSSNTAIGGSGGGGGRGLNNASGGVEGTGTATGPGGSASDGDAGDPGSSAAGGAGGAAVGAGNAGGAGGDWATAGNASQDGNALGGDPGYAIRRMDAAAEVTITAGADSARVKGTVG